MTIRQIEEFLILCEYCSFSKASKALYITPSSLSRHISALEESLGVKLIIRNNYEFQLTEEGKLLFNKGVELLKIYNSIIYQLSNKGFTNERMLTIYSEPFNHELLFKTYLSFQEKYQNVVFNIRLIPLASEENAPNLEDADIIVAMSEYIHLPLNSYNFLPLFTDSVCAILSKDHYLFRDLEIDISFLEKIPLLLLTKKEFYQPTLRRFELAVPNFQTLYNNAKRMDPSELHYSLKSGYGWAILPVSLASEYGQDFLMIPLEGEGAELHAVMAWKKDNTNPNIRYFIDIIRALKNNLYDNSESA